MDQKELKKTYARIRSEIDEMDDLDFLALPSFYELIRGQIVSVLQLNEEIEFEFKSEHTLETASTNGNKITLNTYSPLVLGCKNRYEKYLANIGSGSHECGHVLYTDFDLLNSIITKINHERYKFKYSKKLAKQNQVFKNMFKDLMDYTINILEDGYIERCLKLEYPSEGILVKGLDVCNAVKYNDSYSLDEYEIAINKKQETIASGFVWSMKIQNCLGNKVKGLDNANGYIQTKIVEYLDKAKPYSDRYINDCNSHEEVIEVFAAMVYELLLEDNYEENNSKEGNTDSNEPNKEENANINSKGSKVDTNSAPEGHGKPKRQPIPVSASSGGKPMGGIYPEQLNKEIAKLKIEQVLEDNSKSEFKCQSSKVQSEVNFVTSKMNKTLYMDYYKEIEKISKNAQKRIKHILNMRDSEESSTGYYMGSKFESNNVYRNNGRYFSKENVPSEKPDVVFEIMIDQSGSMGEYDKIEAAKKAAICLEDISRNLDIPTHIFSHTTFNTCIVINDLVPFDSRKDNRYRIATIKDEWGNIDTEVLTMACEEIINRKEKNKVVIVISDGLPCSNRKHINYRGVSFKNDNKMDIESLELNACVRYWRKKGINIIGVAIDESDEIKKIYEEGMLDCTDLSKLPKQLVKVFQKYVLKE